MSDSSSYPASPTRVVRKEHEIFNPVFSKADSGGASGKEFSAQKQCSKSKSKTIHIPLLEESEKSVALKKVLSAAAAEKAGQSRRSRRSSSSSDSSAPDVDVDNSSTSSDESEDDNANPQQTSDLLRIAHLGGLRARSRCAPSPKLRPKQLPKKRKFSNIDCVLCACAHRIGPVEAFVTNNLLRVEQSALWNLASEHWSQKVVRPAKEEGVLIQNLCPDDIKRHFNEHSQNPSIQRVHSLHQLSALKKKLSEKIVKYEMDADGTCGEEEINLKAAELILKIIDRESKERTMLPAETSSSAN